MIELRLLGTIEVRDPHGSRGSDSLLTQPKRLALLSYLAAAHPPGFHRRDTLLGLLWPELDEEHARGALSQAIRYLRRSLGEAALVSRGHEEVSLDPERVWCDVAAFRQAFEAGRLEEALDGYRGDFLKGLFVSEAAEFERWLDKTRGYLREQAAAAARSLAQREEAASNVIAAAGWARRAVELFPLDEGAVRDAMQLLDQAGDRVGAILEYEKLSRRLGSELDLEPAPETRALADRIRARSEPSGAAERRRLPSGGGGPARDAPPLATDAAAVSAGTPAVGPIRPQRRGLAVMSVIVGVAAAGAGLQATYSHGTDLEPRRAVVMPFANRTGDASLDPLAYMAADWISQGLAWAEVVQVVPAPHALQLAHGLGDEGSSGDQAGRARRVAEATGAGTIVTGTYYRHRDILEFQAQIVDARTGELLHALEPARAAVADPVAAIDLMSRRAMGALAVRFKAPPMAAFLSPPPTFEAYELFVEGMGLKARAERRAAIERFRAAAEADSTFVTPLVVAAIEHINLSEFVKADSLRRVMGRSRVRLSPLDRLLLRWLEAKLDADYEAGLSAIRELAKISFVFRSQVAADALDANRPREAIEAYVGFDPSAHPVGVQLSTSRRLSDAYHQLAEHREELREVTRARRRHPDLVDPLIWELRALAALGRTKYVHRRIREVENLPSTPWWSAGEVMLEVADELRVHGHGRDSRAVLTRALAWFENRPTEEARTERHRSGYAAALLRSDRPEDAGPVLRSLRAEFPDKPAFLASHGVLLARRGDRPSAERIDRELARAERAFDFGLYPFLRARIAAQLGDREQALALMAQAVADGLVLTTVGPYAPPRAAGRPHLDPAFDGLRADPTFQRLLRPKR